MPYEAQIAPGYAVNVGDFDGDGNEDIFLSQNFFEMASVVVSTTFPAYDFGRRMDAGRGLWMRGKGGGRLEAVPGQKSGILVYGEQRGAALCDFDGDGRVDLAVSQNGAETKLYRNVLGKPGLRVRLAGPPGNPGRSWGDDAAGIWRQAGGGAGNPRWIGLLVGGQHGAGHGVSGGAHANLDSLARRQDHDQRHSGRGAGNHGGHRGQGDGQSLIRLMLQPPLDL